ncbi:Calcium-activated potassium channel subunit alpha-1 [Phytophthora nicotianae]|uniref:Calcium-activated potassium channel subunit alpha-1 n=1 Tax=Phytophthora nicotianae TaxID=4792 RepID=A0A0W8CYS6_PHYNI|nr:Calcium-activated potassium channel subunit alpha-1 [Phytophthora nicotianae]
MKVFSAALFASVTLTCVTCEATTHDERKLIAGGEIVPAGTKTYNLVQARKLAKADGSDFKGGEWATSMGWGVTKDEGFAPPSVELLRVDLQIWTDKKCFEKYSVGDTTFCAGGLKNAGICGIDNGGPLIIESETTDESGDVLVGVAMGADGCGIEGNPGGFARVSSARDWLDDIISGESTD